MLQLSLHPAARRIDSIRNLKLLEFFLQPGEAPSCRRWPIFVSAEVIPLASFPFCQAQEKAGVAGDVRRGRLSGDPDPKGKPE